MTPQWLLLARLDGLLARLNQAQRAIADEGEQTRLPTKIGQDLQQRLSDHIVALTQTRGTVSAAPDVPKHLWSKAKSDESARLLDECLLYLQAARTRGSDRQADLCEITDALFAELALKASNIAWNGYSVFAAEDSYDVLSRVIRVRYPVSGVWDIPVAVHEFGHFLSGHLRQQNQDGTAKLVLEEYKKNFQPPQDLIENQAFGTGIDWSTWLDEIFADVFATYAAGPAFACSCLLFRFDPTAAEAQSDGKHPSFAARAYVILQTLRLLNKESDTKSMFNPTIRILQQSWSEACKAAGAEPDVSETRRRWLDGQISTFYYWLRATETRLSFRSWRGADEKRSWLIRPPANVQGEFTITELVNAAWICRLNDDSSPQRLSDNFVELARRKIQK